MKILDVSHIIEGIENAEEDLESFYGQIEHVQESIRGFRSLDEALKGRSGEAMRSYFDEVHLPFLTLLHQSMINFKESLSEMQTSTEDYESHSSGFIRQSFLEEEKKAWIK